MQLSRFWRSLDRLPAGAASQYEWGLLLGEEWPAAALLLRNTGKHVDAIPCPSLGGDNCPRRLCKKTDGSYRAECQEVPSVCDSVVLKAAEIAVLALDMRKFAGDLVKALNLSAPSRKHRDEAVMLIGHRMVIAGRGTAVFAAVQDQSKGSSIEIFKEIADASKPALLLVPTSMTLSNEQQRYLDTLGVSVRTFEECIEFDSSAGFVATGVIEDCLTRLAEQLDQATAKKQSGPRLLLPADAKWENLTFEFVADEMVQVKFRGQTTLMEPDDFGMKDRRTKKPIGAWAILRSIPSKGGRLSSTTAAGREKLKKHKQGLKEALQATFGITGDPFRSDKKERAYYPLFVVRTDALHQGKQDQRR
jgi:hypothetical protein